MKCFVYLSMYCGTIKLHKYSSYHSLRKWGPNMCKQNDLSEILKEMLVAYQAVYGEALVEILLYGSYARGDFEEDSDVDIVAIVKGSRIHLQEQLKKIWEVSSDLEIDYETIISPTVIPHDEFEKYKNDIPYYRNIRNEGVCISA